MKSFRPSGSALYGAIVMVGIFALISGLAAKLFLDTMFLDRSMVLDRRAKSSAESVAKLALSRVEENPDFGLDPGDRVDVPKSDILGPEQWGSCTFDPDDPYHSTNNLHSDSAKAGFRGTPVPAGAVQIIARGWMNDTESLYEIILMRPGITHAAASSGDLVLSGKNEAASLRAIDHLREMTERGLVDPESIKDKIQKTTVASSKASGDPLVLKSGLTLYGNAISAAGIKQDPDVTFLQGGLPQAYSKRVEIPKIRDITAYDPDGKDQVTTLSPSYNDASNLFRGFNRGSGNVVINGDLNLDGALLYVTGDLTINGNVTGDGALVALGDMSIIGHSDVEAESKVAVIAKGDLEIRGTGSDSSMFSGLIYGENKVSASNITVVGGLVSNNPDDPDAASMEVTDARVVNLPEKTRFDVRTEFAWPSIDPSGQLMEILDEIGAEVVFPREISDLTEPDGTWNDKIPEYRFNVGGTVFDSISDIPGISSSQAGKISKGLIDYTTGKIPNALINFHNSGGKDVSVFQLDPNQLLTITGGFKKVLSRPIKG